MLVVFIHCEYPYKAEVLPITDVAVPIFFALSGYFIYGTKCTFDRIIRIGKIFLWAAALYLLKTEVCQLISLGNLWIPTQKNIINFILFNYEKHFTNVNNLFVTNVNSTLFTNVISVYMVN